MGSKKQKRYQESQVAMVFMNDPYLTEFIGQFDLLPERHAVQNSVLSLAPKKINAEWRNFFSLSPFPASFAGPLVCAKISPACG